MRIFQHLQEKIFPPLLILLIFPLLYPIMKPSSENTLSIGSKRFTESYILGEILNQLAEQVGEAPVDYRPGLGNTGIVYTALREGLIDIYPEYTGTITHEILKLPHPSSLTPQELNPLLKPLGLGVSDSLGFDNHYALAMLKERAEELGIEKISDLASHPELRLGFSQEFLGRMDGWLGLKRSSYMFPQSSVVGIDHSLSYQALSRHQIDVMDSYSTDPKIAKYELKILEDDQHFFPSYEAVLFYRLAASHAFPKTWLNFQNRLVDHLSNSEMMVLNAAAEFKGKTFKQIAHEFLTAAPQSEAAGKRTFWEYLMGPDLWSLTKQHLFLVFGALAPATLAGICLGVVATYWPIIRHPILNLVGIIQTIPSLALLAFLIPLFREIGTLPALVALFLYSLLPIVRNTHVGLMDISSSLRDAALVLGLPFFYRLYWIELPLALRTILAGIKTAAVLNVGMATIAAFIGAGGYGERIVAGLALNDYSLLLAGAIPACILAICVQFGFDLLDYCMIPRGLRI